MGSVVAASALVVVATLVALTIKDTFWPVVWLLVAILPIAWMYSLLTLIPLFCIGLRRWNPWSTGAVVLAATLMVGSPPLGMWPTGVLPIVLLLAAVALLQIEEHDFWPDVPALRSRVFRHRVAGRRLRSVQRPGAPPRVDQPNGQSPEPDAG